eukprot:TRINITY_DN3205_c0_g1_i1.p1 TRINITY_DN3205_c0_g1~~TRINITY_DN3205_c0_g1_i1.p1  ORF type:complete len:218 (+),score=40.38 TRINITY_DN3205_c0_g1_i1:243-896(+)
MEKDSPNDFKFKYIIVGPAGVGKTSLMTQFVEDNFNPKVEATIGIGFAAKTIEVDGKTIKLQLWDTAGQESFRSITHSYYRNSQGALLVYDVTRRETFEQARFWLEELHQHAPPNITIGLVGNKVDLLANFANGVRTEEGQHFAKTNKVLFFEETSAKTAQNVQKIFQETAEDIYKKISAGVIVLESTAPVLRTKVVPSKDAPEVKTPIVEENSKCC